VGIITSEGDNIVVIGGHHGVSNTLKAIKRMPDVNPIRTHNGFENNKITALIQVGDNGGSTRDLREKFGATVKGISGAVGDLTACGAVLSKDQILAAWLPHRFTSEDINPKSLRDISGMAAAAVAKKNGWDLLGVWKHILNRFDRLPAALWSDSDQLFGAGRLLGLDIFGAEFEQTLGPHSMKNIFFAELMLEHQKDPGHALKIFNYFCDIFPDEVLPMSDEATHLRMLMQNGDFIEDEGQLEKLWEHFAHRDPGFSYDPHKHKIVRAWLDPAVTLSPGALRSVERAHKIFIGPGSPFGSVRQALKVNGTKEAFRSLRRRNPNALVVLIMNAVTDPFEMPFPDPRDYIEGVQDDIGRTLTHVLCDNSRIPQWVADVYAAETKKKVVVRKKDKGREIYPPNFILEEPVLKWNKQTGQLSHDSENLARALFKHFFQHEKTYPPMADTLV
jgi:uncharacterized cofD-like protein